MKRTRHCVVLLAVFAAASSLIQAAERPSYRFPPRPLPVGKVFEPSWAAISPEARIFLVAGGRDSANFAQEVVDQRKYWLAHGYTAEQIECFYAVPPAEQVDDAEQFRSLEQDLEDCHLAAPDIIFSAIAAVAANYEQDFFYLYVSAHGTDPPRSQLLPAEVLRSPGAAWFVKARGEAQMNPYSEAYQWFAPYRMELEGAGNAQDWGWASFSTRYLSAQIRPGTRAEDHLFTPKYLARALQKFPVAVKKIVVLQACHSGGFLLPLDDAPDPEESLVTVQNVTVLTAARADRTSFGCDTSDHTTYYGGALQQVLDASAGEGIPARNWQRVHDEVTDKVKDLEGAQKIPGEQRSLPQFFSNTSRSG